MWIMLGHGATMMTYFRGGTEDLMGTEQVQVDGDLVGVPDGLQRLWTPYRMAYIQGEGKREGAQCPFCEAPNHSDEESLIVHRGQTCYVILNLFPYNSGHMLVCPYRHVGDYTELTPAERLELGELTATSMKVARNVANPGGFNLGMNQGALAGAGIANHLHQHVVPRWFGDANFFPIIARTKAIPELLGEARNQLAAAWKQHIEDSNIEGEV